MDSLYVCLFSNGVVKVGRSQRPGARIKQHAERVGCVGVTLHSSRVFKCAGDVVLSELDLIRRCDRQATQRYHYEWFAGLDYEAVCGWAQEYASVERKCNKTPLRRHLDSLPSGGHRAFAKACGINPIYLNQIANGDRQPSPSLACVIERASLGAVTRPELRKDWSAIWPDFYEQGAHGGFVSADPSHITEPLCASSGTDSPFFASR